jgi:hypothetical protein
VVLRCSGDGGRPGGRGGLRWGSTGPERGQVCATTTTRERDNTDVLAHQEKDQAAARWRFGEGAAEERF